MLGFVFYLLLLVPAVRSFSFLNEKKADMDFAKEFYHLALNRSSLSSVKRGQSPELPVVHLVRIPKASSSSMSAVARRIVGCNPPGPCCRWPGDPKGSCPSKELLACEQQNRVIGCTHHKPNYQSMINPSIMSISVMREPTKRSGFINTFLTDSYRHSNANQSPRTTHSLGFLLRWNS